MRRTDSPWAYVIVPAGEIVPPLNGLTYVVNVNLEFTSAKFAVTLLLASMATVQDPVPEHAPNHPSNV